METVWNDVRYAIRGLRNSPIFTVIVVATLALGIGANAVVFGVVRTVLLNPLPYADSDQLVNVVEADGRTPNPETVSYATAQDLKHRTNVFDRLSLWGDAAVRPVHNGVAVQLRGMRVTADFFETLRVRMFMGRSFRPEEDTPHGPDVIVLTHGTWMEHFGGDPTIVGRAIQTIGGRTRSSGSCRRSSIRCTCRIPRNCRPCSCRLGSTERRPAVRRRRAASEPSDDSKAV